MHEFLHKAIRDVLAAAGQPCKPQYIADQIAQRGLWRRPSDGELPPASQIRWRVHSRQDWFYRLQDGHIALTEWLRTDRS